MPAPGYYRPCGHHHRLCAFDPAGYHAVSIHATVPRLPDIWFDSPQLWSRYGNPPRRGWRFGVFPPAAAGDHARGWDADPNSACPYLEISWLGTANLRLSVGRDVSGVVNADLVLSTAETGYRSSRLASVSCVRTLDPSASRFLEGMRKSKPRCLSFHQSDHVPKRIERLYISRPAPLHLPNLPNHSIHIHPAYKGPHQYPSKHANKETSHALHIYFT